MAENITDAKLLYRAAQGLQRNHEKPCFPLPDYEKQAIILVFYDTAYHWNNSDFCLMDYLNFQIEKVQSSGFDDYKKDELVVFYRQLALESLYGGDFV